MVAWAPGGRAAAAATTPGAAGGWPRSVLAHPVPGQLAALCTSLNVDGHGITASTARDLPEPWPSMLAHYRRRTTRAAPAPDGCAATAVALPELTGSGSRSSACTTARTVPSCTCMPAA